MPRSLRVAVIDDYPDSVETIASAIEAFGPHKVSTFTNASAALMAWAELKPDLAFVDIGLPEPMDGCELSRRVQQLPLKTFLVAITGYVQPKDLERCRDAGFHEHMMKPFSLEALEMMLKRAADYTDTPR